MSLAPESSQLEGEIAESDQLFVREPYLDEDLMVLDHELSYLVKFAALKMSLHLEGLLSDRLHPTVKEWLVFFFELVNQDIQESRIG